MEQQSTGRVNILDKRIFGGTTDCNQLIPVKYQWAWQGYLDANKNHWLPGHFQLDTDPPLTHSDQQQVLELYMGWRLAISTAIQEVLPLLYRNTTAPECRQYILRHMQEEATAIDAISESGILDLPNMGLWVVSQAKRVGESMPSSLDMSAASFAVLLSVVVVYKGYVTTALETWLLKETELPPELRKMVKALQRDGVGQRNFYTSMLQQFLTENPNMRELVHASTVETATEGAMAAFNFHWFNRDLSPVIAGKPLQFARHCWASIVQQLGFQTKAYPSPYGQTSTVVAAQQATNTLSWD